MPFSRPQRPLEGPLWLDGYQGGRSVLEIALDPFPSGRSWRR
jgi:hypothetical protein